MCINDESLVAMVVMPTVVVGVVTVPEVSDLLDYWNSHLYPAGYID